jgi:adenylosuccinate lyase
MLQPPERYSSPLAERYASARMSALFSQTTRIRTWRQLWVALAEAERRIGLPVSARQVAALKAHIDDVDFEAVAAIEREVRHDVMAHVRAYGAQAPAAAGIIHLGATSCFVTDNADLIIYRDALRSVSDRLAGTIRALARFAQRYRSVPTLGYTHLQPAQLTTVGKRAALWLQDFQDDFERIAFLLSRFKFRGVKGTTGTQASFLALCDGDARKVVRLDRLVARAFGFTECYDVVGQTYPRKLDAELLAALAGIALSVSKMTNDIRYLQSVGELEESFGARQVGSSAMAYKRNPMRSERADSLARLIISLSSSPQMTAAAQFLERTLDDSANRRIVLPEAFMAADAILLLSNDIVDGLSVCRGVIARRIADALPFLSTESIMMAAVRKGGDRQKVHERLRTHAMEAVAQRRKGKDHDMLAHIAADPDIGLARREIDALLDPQAFIGRAPEQTSGYVSRVRARLRRYRRYFPPDDAGVTV